jgi:hypothetical protein
VAYLHTPSRNLHYLLSAFEPALISASLEFGAMLLCLPQPVDIAECLIKFYRDNR